MQGKKFKFCFLISLLVLVFIFNWVFPYSYLSLTQSVGYRPDPIFLKNYTSELNNLKKQINSNKKDGVENTINDICTLLSENFLIGKHHNVKHKELEILLSKVGKVKENLTVIDDNPFLNLNRDAEDDLNLLIREFESLEDEISAIIQSRTHSRSTLKRQIHNLHVYLASEIDRLNRFYLDYNKGN